MVLATKAGSIVCLSQQNWPQVQVDPHPLRGRAGGKTSRGPLWIVIGSAPVAVVIYEVLMGSVAKDFW